MPLPSSLDAATLGTIARAFDAATSLDASAMLAELQRRWPSLPWASILTAGSIGGWPGALREGEAFEAGAVITAPGVGNFAGIQIFNPTGSGKVLWLVEADFLNTDAADQLQVGTTGVKVTGAGVITPNGWPLARGGAGAGVGTMVAQVSLLTGAWANIGSFSALYNSRIPAANVSKNLNRANGEAIAMIYPGGDLTFARNTANLPLDVHLRWYERNV